MYRLREWFFKITQTNVKRGTRFRTDDRPTQDTFMDLLKSIIFKTESSDRAKEDDGSFNADNNGHVTLATGDQIKNYEQQKTDRSLVVQPDQVTEVVEGEDITIGDFTGKAVSITKDETDTRKNKYVAGLSNPFLTWLGDNIGGSDCDCVTDFNLTLDEGIPSNADIVCVYDTSSFTGQARIDATNLMETWYTNYIAQNPSFTGNLIQLEDDSERWIGFANNYIDSSYSWTPVKITQPDGTINNSPSPIADPVNKKVVMIIFIDETDIDNTSTILATNPYLASGSSITPSEINDELNSITTLNYKNDFTSFTTSNYAKYEVFRSIVYCPAASELRLANNALLHANVIRAIEPSTLTPIPFSYPINELSNSDAEWQTQFDKISTDNVYNSLDGLNYSGLKNYGFSYVVSFIDGTVGSISAAQFNNDIITALTGSGSKTINITGTITYESGNTSSDSVSFTVPL